jgi:hypothetical protein
MEAFSTRDAVLFPNGLHMGGKTMLCHLEDIGSWHIHTGLDAAETHDTSIWPLMNQRSSIFKGWTFYFFGDKLLMVDPKFIGAVLELAFSSSIAHGTVQRMVDQ